MNTLGELAMEHQHHCSEADSSASNKHDSIPEGYSGTVYTCPMHPQVRSTKAESCPICGMGLEPETVSLEEEDQSELRDMSRRFWVAVVLAIPLVFLAMGGLIPGVEMDSLVPHGIRVWLELGLATPVVLWCGWPFFVRGCRSVVTWILNMFTLIALGV
ncbi:MAG TPA: heavy metal-binding domain-containing protein, partial [Xanthomonadales bacterium]|nr:heavy metal-binding domain-containing protein [Xanthomonadales bacterium]